MEKVAKGLAFEVVYHRRVGSLDLMVSADPMEQGVRKFSIDSGIRGWRRMRVRGPQERTPLLVQPFAARGDRVKKLFNAPKDTGNLTFPISLKEGFGHGTIEE